MIPEDLKPALILADKCIGANVETMTHADLNTWRVSLETAKRPLSSWVREYRRNAYRGRQTDRSFFERAERAEMNLAAAIGAVHAEFGKRRGLRLDTEDAAPRAEETAKRLAAEVERLQHELALRGDNAFYAAFYDAARVILAENTVSRISERARQMMRRK